MLLVIILITMVLTWALDGRQKRQAAFVLLCAAMMSAYAPAIHAAKAEDTAQEVQAEGGAVPMLADEQVLVNGEKKAQIGAVTYSVSEGAYVLDTASPRARVGVGDVISFKGMVSAPAGETISWIRVDVYDAMTQAPYTVGAEYYRADGLQDQQFDLASIPALTIGEAFGRQEYMLAEGGKYIVMFCVGFSDGTGFADMDADMEENQGPAVLVDVRVSPENCKHPHSDYVYILHSSGEIRKQSYGDPLTHQVEPLYERYCGLCDTFLMNIWGQGTAEEHALDVNGVCMWCGYYDGFFEGEPADDETTESLLESIVETTNPDRQVNVVASWEKEELAIGDTLTLTAELTGYEGLTYTIFWQCDMGDGFETVDMATGHASIQFVVDEMNMLWRWRAGVSIDVEIQTAQEGAPIGQETAGENNAEGLNTEEAAE